MSESNSHQSLESAENGALYSITVVPFRTRPSLLEGLMAIAVTLGGGAAIYNYESNYMNRNQMKRHRTVLRIHLTKS